MNNLTTVNNHSKSNLYIPQALRAVRLQFTNTDRFRNFNATDLLTRKKDDLTIVDAYVFALQVEEPGALGLPEYRIYYLIRPIWAWHKRWAEYDRANVGKEDVARSLGAEFDLGLYKAIKTHAGINNAEWFSAVVIPYKERREDINFAFRFVLLKKLIDYVEKKHTIYEYERTVMETVVKRTMVGLPQHITQTDDPFLVRDHL